MTRGTLVVTVILIAAVLFVLVSGLLLCIEAGVTGCRDVAPYLEAFRG